MKKSPWHLLVLLWMASLGLCAQRPLIYGVSPYGDSLLAIDTTTWKVARRIAPTLPGYNIEGLTSLTYDPCGNQTFTTLKLTGVTGRVLARMDLRTGACTMVGNLADKFAALAVGDSGRLYGLTGDGAVIPEALYGINPSTASKTLLTTLGAGADGEAMAFHPPGGQLYHWSGDAPVVYEKLIPQSPFPVIPISAGAPYQEIYGAAFLGPNRFLVSHIGGFRYVDTLGNFGPMIWTDFPDVLRGLVVGTDFAVAPLHACPGDTVWVRNTGAALHDLTLVYVWGDGGTDTTLHGAAASHVYATQGPHLITVLSGNALCGWDTLQTLVSQPLMTLTPGDTLLCPGDSLLLVASFAVSGLWMLNGDTLPGAVNDSLWVFSAGIYNAVTTSASGCTDSASTGTHVQMATPVAAFGAGLPDTTHAGLAEFLPNGSTGMGLTLWHYGDGSPPDTVFDATHTWSLAGTYPLMLVAQLGSCADTVTKDMVVLDSLVHTPAAMRPPGLELWPQPALGGVWVKAPAGGQPCEVALFSPTGARVSSLTLSEDAWWDLRALPAGVYVARAIIAGQMSARRVILLK